MKTKLITVKATTSSNRSSISSGARSAPRPQKVAWRGELASRECRLPIQQKRLREIDRRVRYLRKCLEELGIVDYSPPRRARSFRCLGRGGKRGGETKRFRIVGYDEIFGARITSPSTPMARALLKKEVGDEAIVQTPVGDACWYINEISYPK
jgi:transcription elongation factor GreB